MDCETMKYSDKVKSQLLAVFQEMTNKLNCNNFNEIFAMVASSGAVVKNPEQVVQAFKDDLNRKIYESFNDMWNDQEIDLQLNSLNIYREKCKNNTTAWRATGQTPEEQTKYLRVHYLKRKIKFIEQVLQMQLETFESTSKEVQEKRGIFEHIITRRDDISAQMDMRMAQINKVDSGNVTLQKDLCDH